MASKYKSPSELELVAIYRLEFYKKQKNWKFCQDLCKKKPPEPVREPEQVAEPVKSAKTSKSDLNKTYNLDEVDAADLNDAFLEPDPDKILPVTPPDPDNPPSINNLHKTEPNTPQQKWPESDQIWPEQWPATEQQWPESQQQWQESDQKWPEQEKRWQESQEQSPESEQIWLQSQQKWQEPQQQWQESQQQLPEVKNWLETDRIWSVPEMPAQGWQNIGQEWGGEEAYYPQDGALRAYEPDKGWGEPCAEADVAYEDQPRPEAVLSAADSWLRGAPQLNLHQDARDDAGSASLESVASFMRGAALAPHSSEVDLNLSDGVETPLSHTVAACLSQQKLAAAVSTHARALRLLLREAQARDALQRRSLHPATPLPFGRPPTPSDERPTRDIGLLRPAPASEARGRGRLQRDRIIGIGMGRPYRL